MKNLSIIILFILLLNGNAFAKVKSKDITFPGKYYTKEIKTCSAILWGIMSLLKTVRETVSEMEYDKIAFLLSKTFDGLKHL